MRRFSFYLLVTAALATPAAATTLPEVQAAFAATRTMTARFTQTAQDGRVATGTLTLARPGRVRFAYDKAPLLIVADGKRLVMVDYEVKQVSQWPLGRTPLGVLLDPAADLARYARVLPEQAATPGRVALEAADPRRADLGRLTVYLARDAAAPGGLALTGWRSFDAQGNTTVVQLADVKYNPAVAPAAFTWRDPRGVRVPARN